MSRHIPPAAHDPSDESPSNDRAYQMRAMLAQAQALSSRLSTLNETAIAIQRSLDTTTIGATIVAQARWVIDFQHCSLALCDGDYYILETLHRDDGEPLDVQRLALSDTLVSRTLCHGQTAFRSTLSSFDDGPAGMQSALIMPLRNGDAVIGTLNLYAREPHHYKLDDLQIATALAVQVSATIQHIHQISATTRARDELSTVLESISDGVLVIDLTGRIVLINRSLRNLLHLSARDFSGQRALRLLRGTAPREEQRKTRTAIRPLLDALQVRPLTGETGRMQLLDGRHIEWVAAPLAATDTRGGFVLTLRDVSAQVALAQLHHDMVHMIVHDLRAPLTTLMMGLEMLKPPYNTEPELTETTLEYMSKAAQDLFHQVDTILDVSKLEVGAFFLERTLIDIRALVTRGVATMQPMILRDRQEFALDLPNLLPLFYGDTSLLLRVIENLLGNAVKFTPPGGKIALRTRFEPYHHVLVIEVEDTGLGVPSEMRERIFEKYIQVRQGRGQTGTGLGLAFCKLVVEAHGGEIGVRDAAERGSIFWFTLPIDTQQ